MLMEEFQCPAGYRFRPYDEELIVHYLYRKVKDQPLPVNGLIIDADVYKFNPEQLSERYKRPGETDCYFFSPRQRKYPNGTRPNRAAGEGYWKASAADKSIIYGNRTVGFRKSLVFYRGKPPNHDSKTNWIMHEFRLNQPPRTKANASDMRLDDYVLCRIHICEKSKRTQPKRNIGADDCDLDSRLLINHAPVTKTNYEDQLTNVTFGYQSHVNTNPTVSSNWYYNTNPTHNPTQQPSNQYTYTSPNYDLPQCIVDNDQAPTYDATYSAPPPSMTTMMPSASPVDGNQLLLSGVPQPQPPTPHQLPDNSPDYVGDELGEVLGQFYASCRNNPRNPNDISPLYPQNNTDQNPPPP